MLGTQQMMRSNEHLPFATCAVMNSLYCVFWHFFFNISLYNQKRYLIADTRKPLREKAMVRKTDTFTRSSRRKVIPGQGLAGHGAAVQGWRKGTRRRLEWEGAEDRTRGRRTPGSLGVDCWLPDPPPHKPCLPQLRVLRAHTGAPSVCFCFWMIGCSAQGQELGWGL